MPNTMTMDSSGGTSSSNGSKPALITRAESAPPTRGREGFETARPLTDAPPAPPPRPPTRPARTNGEKSSSKPPEGPLRRPKRMLPRDPMTSRCSLAMSRTESLLVSSSGDVMVCRCRRSSTPYIRSKGSHHSDALMDPWTNLIPCCDTPDCTLDGPWSPVFDLTVRKQTSGDSSTMEGSTYEWEKTVAPKAIMSPLTKKRTTSPTPMNQNSTPSPTNRTNDRAMSIKTPNLKPAGQSDNVVIAPPTTDSNHRPPTEESMMEFNAYDGEILPLPSFDYDHIHQGQNDMVSTEEEGLPHRQRRRVRPPEALSQVASPGANRRRGPTFPVILESPEEKKDEMNSPEGVSNRDAEQLFYHGIPVFLSTLSQIRIVKVSAHPLGAHTLLISDDALLFTYGLNNRGQLGIGIKTSVNAESRGFHTTPTLITPLLENGGKAIHCAAGVDHSLVVVATEGRRLHKLQTSPDVAYSDHGAATLTFPRGRSVSYSTGMASSRSDDQDSLRHHQLYGFGSNDFMKIGLVSARLADDGAEGDGEDILLPRRVALHCNVWPNKEETARATEGSSLPHQGIFDIAASNEHSAALVRRATGDIEVYMWGNATLGALGLPVSQDPEVKIQGALTQRPVSNANNIFPLPTVLEKLTYRPNRDSPWGFPRQVALGPYCSFVVMSTGRCFSFGFSAEGMLGQKYGTTHTMDAKEMAFPPTETKEDGIVSISAGAYHAIALTQKGHAYSWGINSDDRLGLGPTSDNPGKGSDSKKKENMVVIEWAPQRISGASSVHSNVVVEESLNCIEACAGYDSTMLVTRSGQVYSFGKRSGRLGQGEITGNVCSPNSLHGGLRLFHNSRKTGRPHGDSGSHSRTKPLLKRILSDGAVNQK